MSAFGVRIPLSLIAYAVIAALLFGWHVSKVRDARRTGAAVERAACVNAQDEARAKADAERAAKQQEINEISRRLTITLTENRRLANELASALDEADRTGVGARPGLDRSIVRGLNAIGRR